MEAAMECKDVPHIAWSHANISIAVDATGSFENPFAAAAAAEVDAVPTIDDVKETDAKVSAISFTEKRDAPGAPLRQKEVCLVHLSCAWRTSPHYRIIALKIEPFYHVKIIGSNLTA